MVACYLNCFCKDLCLCIGNALRRDSQRRCRCRCFHCIIILALFQLRRTLLKDDPTLVEYRHPIKSSFYQLLYYRKTTTVCCTSTCGRKEITKTCTSMRLNRCIIKCINSTRKISMACFTYMTYITISQFPMFLKSKKWYYKPLGAKIKPSNWPTVLLSMVNSPSGRYWPSASETG